VVDTLSLLIGGAIGFVSAVLAPILVEPLRHWVFGPKLKIEFIEGDRGFKTDTKENVIVNDPQMSETPIHTVTDAYYIRVRVTNTGRQIAKQCRAYLVNVEKWNKSTSKFEPTIYCDSLQLAWSARGTVEEAYRPLDLPKLINQFVDIVSTRKIEAKYRIETNPKLKRYAKLFKEHGKFRYTVQVSGDNVKPEFVKVIVDWSGNWENFTVNAG